MNILQINASDSNISGASRVMFDLTLFLEKLGNDISVYSGTQCIEKDNFHKIKTSRLSKGISLLMANDVDFFNTDYILKTDDFKRADIIHCHNLHGWYFNLDTVRKMSQIKPIVWTLHDMWAITAHCCHTFQNDEIVDGFYKCSNKKIYPPLIWHNEKYLRWKKRRIYDRSNINIVVPSIWLMEKVRRSVLGGKSCHLIYNGIDTDQFIPLDKQTVRHKLGLPSNKKIVLFIAGSGHDGYEYKGGKIFEMVADRYKKNPSIQFVCIGASSEVRKEKLGIIFIDQIKDKHVLAEYYSASDCFLFLSRAENFPLVILEAMSCGLPIVSFDVGGVREAVVHGINGFIAKYNDIGDVIRGLEKILGLNKDDFSKMSRSSIMSVSNNFTARKMTNEYLSLYQSILSETIK